MAKIVSYSGRIPKRILDNYVIYNLGEDLIIREKSGFTREALLRDAKYANCRRNSSEFGRVSKTCKGIRVALAGLLPKNKRCGCSPKEYRFRSHVLVLRVVEKFHLFLLSILEISIYAYFD